MKTEIDCRCDKRINQLEEALRSIVNGDMRLSKTMARCALEGASLAMDEKPEQEAESHCNVFAVHDASGKTVGHFEVDEKANKELVGATAETPWEIKEGYWYEQYRLMRERYHRQIGENSRQAERIRELEEHTFLVTELQPKKDAAERIRELEEQLKAKQGKNLELYAMLGHIVDWSPELPYYMKDEYKTLFRNALAAARELLSKCSVKDGKPKQGPIENIIDGLYNQSDELSTEELASELKEDGIDIDGLKKRVFRLIAEAKRQEEGK